MPDKVKPLKLESPSLGGTQTDVFPTETNPTQDYLAAKGVAFENNDSRLIDLDGSGNIQFTDVTETTPINVRQLRTGSQNIFGNGSTSFRATNVDAAIKEVRNNFVLSSTSTATTLNGTLTLVNTSNSLQFITGTQTGYSIVLPDATTLFSGMHYEIWNASSQTITIKTNGGTTLTTLAAGAVLYLVLQVATPAAGSWQYWSTFSNIAAGIINYNIVSTTGFVTSSTTEVLITSFTVTPQAGTYAVWVSMAMQSTASGSTLAASIYKAAVQVADSTRNSRVAASNANIVWSTMSIIQVNGSQAIDVRASTSSASLTVGARSLMLIRIGT